jgi:hypothetical protein
VSDRATEMKEYLIYECPCKTKGCVFPSTIENDPLVYFHATDARNFDAIVEDGFKSKNALCGCGSPYMSFGKRSCVSYGYLIQNHKPSEEWRILAIRYINTDPNDLRADAETINPITLVPPPEIIGYCIIPADHQYCYGGASCQFEPPNEKGCRDVPIPATLLHGQRSERFFPMRGRPCAAC